MKLLLIRPYRSVDPGAATTLRAWAGKLDQVTATGDALSLLQINGYDACVIDASPTQGGHQMIDLIRAEGDHTPVLLLTASSCGKARALALRCGADDLLTKPYHADELIARIESIIRRRRIRSCPVLRLGPLQLNMASKEAHLGKRLLDLTVKEFMILELLALRAGRVVSENSFAAHMYGGKEAPISRVLDVCICSLRKKLAAAGGGSLIQTIRLQGYVIRDFVPTPADIIPFFAENGQRTATTVTHHRKAS